MTIPLEHQIRIETDNEDDVACNIRDELIAYNAAQAGPLRERRIVLSVRDSTDELIGGLVGWTFWSTLFVELLWVAETLRRQGMGRALMQRAEAEAKQRGCRIAFLSTFSFQAPASMKRLATKPSAAWRIVRLGRLEPAAPER